MGIGPVFAIPKLLEATGLTMNDIDLVELNEAFASQCLYSRDKLEIDPEIYNVNGGSISIGHPFGMTGSRLTGHLVRELKRREKKYGIVSMCIGGGMGAAGLFSLPTTLPVSRFASHGKRSLSVCVSVVKPRSGINRERLDFRSLLNQPRK